MKIESVRIENFRCFKDDTIYFNDYTCFVGANGSGKSTVFNALNVFFRQEKDCSTDLSRLTIEDFHHKDTKHPIKITITFTDLTKEAIEDFADYVRLGKLIISSTATFNPALGYAEVKQNGNRMNIKEFAQFFSMEKEGKKVDELRHYYVELRKQFPNLPEPGTKQKMKGVLNSFAEKNPNKCELLESEDQFYGWSKGVKKLAKYIQWVFVPASKDYSAECEETKNSAIGQLLSRTVRLKTNFEEKIKKIKEETQTEYQTIIESEQSVLNQISISLESRLSSWAHPGISANVKWKDDVEKSIRIEEPIAFVELAENNFEGNLARFGHGVQRSFMLAILQELSSCINEKTSTLIMAIEEPEIYQHPPQARHLAAVLQNLSEQSSQIMICSHSPLFIPGNNFESVRIVRDKGNPLSSYTTLTTYSDFSKLLDTVGQKDIREQGVLAKLFPSLNAVINEMFFCNKLILTEGISDIAYISTYLLLTGNSDEFRRQGCHIVPCNSKSEIIKPLALANLLEIPVFVICDADTDKGKIEDESRRKSEMTKHQKDNRAIINLCGYESESEWPKSNIHHQNLTMWATNIEECLEEELNGAWEAKLEEARICYNQVSGLKKNPLAIAKALTLAWEANIKSKILEQLVHDVMSFANF